MTLQDTLVRVIVLILSVACSLTSISAETTTSSAPLEPSEPEYPAISIALFDPGIPEDTSTHRQLGVFPAVRAVEARFLPFVLREILMESDQWGAVRVVPNTSPGDEILVNGTILKSNGETLELQLTAKDATGKTWVDGIYSMNTGIDNPDSNVEISASFHNVFRSFAADLLAKKRKAVPRDLSRNQELALIQYAATILPDMYSSYATVSEDGRTELVRLPAEGDPMIERITRLRQFEYRFVDAIDAQYEALYSRISTTYNLWLRYQERLTRYRKAGEESRTNRASSDRPGSFNAMRESYEHYKWLKMEEQNLRKWALGFRNEVDPTVVDVEGRIVELDGTLQERYDAWREILVSIVELELGDTR